MLREWSVSLAVLDAIMSPEWETRYFSFDPSWGEDQEMASMRNGSGDDYAVVFAPAGAYVRGFDHESPLSPWARPSLEVVRGLTEGVPAALREHVTEPAFTLNDVPSITVCGWREASAQAWTFGEPLDPGLRGEDGGASWLFAELDGRPETYQAFAEAYYEVTVPLPAVAALFERRPLTPALVAELNPEADFDDVVAEVTALGY